MTSTNNSIRKTTFLIYSLLIVNTTLVLAPTWGGSFILAYIDIEDFLFLSVRVTRFINLFLFILIIFYNGIRQTTLLVVILVTFFLMIVSKVANSTIEEITTPVEFLITSIALFCSFGKLNFSKRFIEILSLVFIIWSIAPVLYLPVAPASHKLMLFATDENAKDAVFSFCGFANHRNVYGYYAGISILLVLFSSYRKTLKFFLLSILSIGLFLAASRGSLLATAFAVIFFYFKGTQIKQKIVVLVSLVIAVILLVFFGSMYESRLLTEAGGRSELYNVGATMFLESPFFGYGKSTLLDINHFEGVNSPAHNFILQTLLDYGLLALIPFLLIIWLLFKQSCKKSQSFLLFLLVVGFVQPYYSLNAPSQFTLISYLFIIVFNSLEQIEKYNYFNSIKTL